MNDTAFFVIKGKEESLLATNQCFVSFYVFFDGNFLLILEVALDGSEWSFSVCVCFIAE